MSTSTPDLVPPGAPLVRHDPGYTLVGHSDDIVCLEGWVREELPAGSDELRILVGTREAQPGVDAHGVYLLAHYAPEVVDDGNSAVWAFTVAMVDEGVTCPWPLTVLVPPNPGGPSNRGSSVTYSPRVTVHCPEGTPIRVERRRRGKGGAWFLAWTPETGWDTGD